MKGLFRWNAVIVICTLLSVGYCFYQGNVVLGMLFFNTGLLITAISAILISQTVIVAVDKDELDRVAEVAEIEALTKEKENE